MIKMSSTGWLNHIGLYSAVIKTIVCGTFDVLNIKPHQYRGVSLCKFGNYQRNVNNPDLTLKSSKI